MAKWLCLCGQTIRSSGAISNPDEWRLLSDVDFERFDGTVDAEEIYLATTIAYRCPASDHLWIFWNGIGRAPSIYAPAPTPQGWLDAELE
jgi:hypothetical protein